MTPGWTRSGWAICAKPRQLGPGGLRELARRGNGHSGSAQPAPGLDAGSIRMTFPAHVAIRLRSGGLLEADGREHGGSGAPLEEQEQVVSEKFALAREAAEMPKAWRRPSRPVPTA